MAKRCVYCGRYFRPDKRVENRQKVCTRMECRRQRKKYAQQTWKKNNPGYFIDHYRDYINPWRQKRCQKKENNRQGKRHVIKDEIPTSKPYQELVLIIPAESAAMIKDEIRLRRVDSITFAAYGG